jgi:peptide/nickel transport system substrate-binding protein
MMVERIEWVIMPDPATAAAALQNGEIDWWENPITDLVPVLRRNRTSRRHRRSARQHRQLPHEPPAPALQRRAGPPRGDDGAEPGRLHARPGRRRQQPLESLPGFFTPGTPLYTEEGGEILKGPRNLERRAALLREAGYNNQPVDLRGRAGPADHQGDGRRDRRPAEADRHERRLSSRPTGAPSASAAR